MQTKRGYKSMYWLAPILICTALYLLIFPKMCSKAMTSALKLSVHTVVPAVFPYLVLSGTFVGSGLADRMGRFMEYFTRRLFGITKVAALAYLMFNLFTPPCFAAIGAMHAEIKSRKWFWGGIALQLGTGYTVGYLVYTVGTAITAPATLSVPAAIGGGIFVLLFAAVLGFLCIRGDRMEQKTGSYREG